MEEAREEVETLKDIFDDCIVDATETSLTVELTPTTDGDRDEHGHLWVRIVVDASIPGYPAAGDAKFSIEKQRGLSNQQLRALSAAGEESLRETKGEPQLFTLIDSFRDTLTQLNAHGPHGHVCTVCRDAFADRVRFVRTPCFHFFHPPCWKAYVQECHERNRQRKLERQADKRDLVAAASNSGNANNSRNMDTGLSCEQFLCPVCREDVPTPDKMPCGGSVDAPPFSNDTRGQQRYKPDPSMREQQRRMQARYEQQRKAGGIIDVEAEQERVTLLISQTKKAEEEKEVETAGGESAAHGEAGEDEGGRGDQGKPGAPQEDTGKTMTSERTAQSSRRRGRGRGHTGRGAAAIGGGGGAAAVDAVSSSSRGGGGGGASGAGATPMGSSSRGGGRSGRGRARR